MSLRTRVKDSVLPLALSLFMTALVAGLVACGGGGGGGNDPEPLAQGPTSSSSSSSTSSSSSSSSSSTSSSSGGAVVGTSNWSEAFNVTPVVNSGTFYSTAYATLPSPNTTVPLYAATGGTPTFASGVMTLANARFTVGALAGTATTGTTTPGGIFTIVGKTCTLTAVVTSTNSTGNFVVYVDNNTTTAANSPHAALSRVVNVTVSSLIVGTNTFPSWALSTSGFSSGSFLQIRVDSTGSVTFDSLSLNCV